MQLCCQKSRKREETPRLMVMASWLDFFVVVVVVGYWCMIVLLSSELWPLHLRLQHDMSLSKQAKRSKKKNSSGVSQLGAVRRNHSGLSGIMKRKGNREQGRKGKGFCRESRMEMGHQENDVRKFVNQVGMVPK